MKRLTIIAITAVVALLAHVRAAELSAPLALSAPTRTNDVTGQPAVTFRVSNASKVIYYYYFQIEVPSGGGWVPADVQSADAASAHPIQPRQTFPITVALPKGSDRWRIRLRHHPQKLPRNHDTYVYSEEIVER